MIAELPAEEKKMAVALVKRNAFELSETLTPLLGESLSKLVFGLGVFGMGFSTIIILMLINGYAFREMVNKPNSTTVFGVGVLVAGIAGASWFYFWTNPDLKFYLAIYASTFGSMLLPVAYIAFLFDDEQPQHSPRRKANRFSDVVLEPADGFRSSWSLSSSGYGDL